LSWGPSAGNWKALHDEPKRTFHSPHDLLESRPGHILKAIRSGTVIGDFGPAVFTLARRWLEILRAVQPILRERLPWQRRAFRHKVAVLLLRGRVG